MAKRRTKAQRAAQQRRSRRRKLYAAGARGATLAAALDDPTVDADQALAELRWWPKAIVDPALLAEHLKSKTDNEECLALGCGEAMARDDCGIDLYFCRAHLGLVDPDLINRLQVLHAAGARPCFTVAADAAILAVKQSEDPRGAKALRKGRCHA